MKPIVANVVWHFQLHQKTYPKIYDACFCLKGFKGGGNSRFQVGGTTWQHRNIANVDLAICRGF